MQMHPLKKKICSHCKIEKSVSEFVKKKQNKDGLHSWCDNCRVGQYKIYSKKYGGTAKGLATRKKWRDNNREKYNRMLLKSHLKRHYNLTIEQYEGLLESQNGVCAICKRPEKYKNRKYLAVDHDHVTEKIRGLLCNKCNCVLGYAEDNPLVLKAAVEYLKNG